METTFLDAAIYKISFFNNMDTPKNEESLFEVRLVNLIQFLLEFSLQIDHDAALIKRQVILFHRII